MYTNGTLYRKPNKSHLELRAVPTPAERPGLLKMLHDEMGHLGKNKLVALMTTRYFWRGIARDCAHHVASCTACKAGRVEFQAPLHMQPRKVVKLGYRWHADIMGPFPTTPRGNKVVAVYVESLSGYPEAYPLSNHQSATLTTTLSDLISCHGVPAVLVTDAANDWCAEFAELLRTYGIRHERSAAYNPQSNGKVERMVGTPKRGLERYVASNPDNSTQWDTKLFNILLGYRAAPQASTRFFSRAHATRQRTGGQPSDNDSKVQLV